MDKDKVTLSFTQKAGFAATAVTFFAFRCIAEPHLDVPVRVDTAIRETEALWAALQQVWNTPAAPADKSV